MSRGIVARRALPARIPPDEALVEQQSAPWRVFDAPSETGGAGGAAPAPSGSAGAGGPLAALANQRLAIAGVVGAIAVGGLAVVIAISGAGAATVEGPGTAISPGGSGDPVSVVGEIVVDVSGAVVKPGVYRLATGARVGDAIESAGGFSPRVDVDRVGAELNLASTLSDGAQVRVPSRDDPAPTTGTNGSGSGGSDGSGRSLVNLNTASESELDTLPGIGPVTAGKIIESRSGAPFKTVEDLRERGLVGEKAFEKLKPLVSVG